MFPSYDILKVMLKKFEKNSFDFIFVNQEMIEYSFEEFQQVIPVLVKYLNVKQGNIIVNSIIPNETGGLNTGNSDTWKFLVYLKSFGDIDSAVGAFDSGILVFHFRPNHIPGIVLHNDTSEIEAIVAERHRYRAVTPLDHFFAVADRFIPILDFYHMMKWLSGNGNTFEYTSVPWNKVCSNASLQNGPLDDLMSERDSRPYIEC